MSGRIIALGECMVELAPAGDGLFRRSFAGDTFNTAWYLRRLLRDEWSVAYGSCIGTDSVSDQMLAFMTGAGIATDAIRRIGDRTVGLYMIELVDGERSFTYWRGQAAARMLAADPDWLSRSVEGATLVILSGITVAITPPEHRPVLLGALRRARAAGSVIAFDPNLRPRLWPDADTMCAAVAEAAGVADVCLPSLEDEQTHFGDRDAEATVARYRGLGARTVVVKNGPGRITAWDAAEGEVAVDPAPVRMVDSTAAGDSFNAGFLAARLNGAGLEAALRQGAALAAEVCLAPGALVAVRGAPG